MKFDKAKGGLGLRPNPFTLVKDKYKIPPMTVWELDYTSSYLRSLKQIIGDDGTTRGELAQEAFGYKTALGSSNTGVSIFNPMVVVWLLDFYAHGKNIVVYDPFAGGGTRAFVTAALGHRYTGKELRQQEIERIYKHAGQHGLLERIDIHLGDSCIHDDTFKDNSADLLITCPPYYNLEKYNGGEDDLSMLDSYTDFIAKLEKCVFETKRILKPDGVSCWVMGMIRDSKGVLIPMHHDVTTLHHKVGFQHKEEVALYMKNTGSVQRIGNFDKGNNFLIRTHEYCEVYVNKK